MRADRETTDVAAGEEGGLDDVRVGRQHKPAIADAHGAAVVHGRDANHASPRFGISGERAQERALDETTHRAPAGAVLERNSVVGRYNGHD